jgi:hypothetical protein
MGKRTSSVNRARPTQAAAVATIFTLAKSAERVAADGRPLVGAGEAIELSIRRAHEGAVRGQDPSPADFALRVRPKPDPTDSRLETPDY